MLILGLNATGPNTSACLVDSQIGIVGFAEEERFTRVKLATDSLPVRAIKYVLDEGGFSLADVDTITIGWDHSKYPERMAAFYDRRMNHAGKDDYSKNLERTKLNDKSVASISKKLEIGLYRGGLLSSQLPAVQYEHHHQSHAASVFLPSPFEKAVVVVVDGSGEELGTSVWRAERGKQFTPIREFELPDSLGYFYAAMTEFLGFSVFTGEGKVMGMAPYGKPDQHFRSKLQEFLIPEERGQYRVNPEFVYFGERKNSFRFTSSLGDLLGIPPRIPESEIEQVHYNLAYEVQNALEVSVGVLVKQVVSESGIRNVCVAGGVANNCKMNGYLASLDFVDSCFVIPASADSGVAYGSALLHLSRSEPLAPALREPFSAYQGPSFSTSQVLKVLEEAKIEDYVVLDDETLFQEVAEYLAQGSIVGWFQGRMEVGARALGNRSILANPAYPEMKDRLNREVKRREAFRPFAPSVLAEHADEWFDFSLHGDPLETHRWMIQATPAREEAKLRIPAVVHVDGSVRPQVVHALENERYHRLISEFSMLTGIPVLLNTSLNVRGEPIICRPEEALRCFFSHGLDVLVMENVVLRKTAA